MSEGLAQGLCTRGGYRLGFEPVTFPTQGTELSAEPQRPTSIHPVLSAFNRQPLDIFMEVELRRPKYLFKCYSECDPANYTPKQVP